jgi:hypothetical protein
MKWSPERKTACNYRLLNVSAWASFNKFSPKD